MSGPKRSLALMFLLMVFTAGLFAFTTPVEKSAATNECPAGAVCNDDAQAADGLIWESVSRHLLNVIQ